MAQLFIKFHTRSSLKNVESFKSIEEKSQNVGFMFISGWESILQSKTMTNEIKERE